MSSGCRWSELRSQAEVQRDYQRPRNNTEDHLILFQRISPLRDLTDDGVSH